MSRIQMGPLRSGEAKTPKVAAESDNATQSEKPKSTSASDSNIDAASPTPKMFAREDFDLLSLNISALKSRG